VRQAVVFDAKVESLTGDENAEVFGDIAILRSGASLDQLGDGGFDFFALRELGGEGGIADLGVVLDEAFGGGRFGRVAVWMSSSVWV
jgi:hypothetical protein